MSAGRNHLLSFKPLPCSPSADSCLRERVCVGFSHCCLHVRLETGFTAFSIQRASAGASCYCVTTQTWHRSAQPVAADEKLPQERDPITWLVVHLLYESGAILTATSRLPVCFKASLLKDALKMCLGEIGSGSCVIAESVRSRFCSGSSF